MEVPTRRELRKARRRRRRPGERVLRGLIVLVVCLLVIGGLGYGYLRFEWSKVASSPCSSCVAAANGAPYNVLVVGSDSRAGETAAEAQHFGTPSEAAGQRSDTIKVVHVDPASGTASTLSIPRDTYVTLSGVPASTGLSPQNKINAAFGGGPDALVKTVENTFGIPISHYIVINFFGLQDAVNALGGISMYFPYPVRDHDCSTGVCNNNSGLDIPTTGCLPLNGAQALALSRSRYFQYEVDGVWNSDPTGDIGRIERQNLIISAALNKAKSTYDPLRLNSLLTSVVHDFSKDNGLTVGDMFSLAERYHAFSGSQLQDFTLPTVGAYTPGGSAVEVVQPDEASQMISKFLGTSTTQVTTPPLDSYGNALTFPVATTVPAVAATVPATTAPSTPAASTTPAPPATNAPSYDPTPC